MSFKIKAITAIFALTLHGCASLTTESTQEIFFTSKPAGTKLYNYNGKELLCEMPCALSLERSGSRFFIARLEGYKTQSVKLSISRNTNNYGNAALISAYHVGSVIDGFTGTKYELQGSIEVVMQKEIEDEE